MLQPSFGLLGAFLNLLFLSNLAPTCMSFDNFHHEFQYHSVLECSFELAQLRREVYS